MKNLDFDVTICLGGGDGGDVRVEVAVTDEEYELMKSYYRDCGETELDDDDDLEELINRVREEALGEDEFCLPCGGDEDDYDEDYDCATCRIWIPDEITDAVDAEEDDDEE